MTSPDGRAGIDAALVRRLVDAQFPRWRGLPIRPVDVDGWDNRTYRLGDDKTVRLPTAEGYVPAVAKENEWLPRLAPSLPVAVPRVLGEGVPGGGYPFPWSVRNWLNGTRSDQARVDLPRFAEEVGEFLLALQKCDAEDGPVAGAHSWYRGASLTHYDDETRRCLHELDGRVDSKAAAVWDAALAAEWRGTPVWFHGDIAAGNLLVENGRLAAVIDFGTCGVGDPACDLVIAWTMFAGDSRDAFRRTVDQDDGTWARARGWLLWKALLTLTGCIDTDPDQAAASRREIAEVVADARLGPSLHL
jgi:aminoglycoside phosphotransferase (APT) family kinase protein